MRVPSDQPSAQAISLTMRVAAIQSNISFAVHFTLCLSLRVAPAKFATRFPSRAESSFRFASWITPTQSTLRFAPQITSTQSTLRFPSWIVPAQSPPIRLAPWIITTQYAARSGWGCVWTVGRYQIICFWRMGVSSRPLPSHSWAIGCDLTEGQLAPSKSHG